MSDNQGPYAELMSEVDLLQFLNIERKTLDGLRREKGFPYVRLTVRDRVYLLSDVLEWARKHRVSF